MMKNTMRTAKGGPMRAILSTSRYTALMHGLTRQKGKEADVFKDFLGNRNTFTHPVKKYKEMWVEWGSMRVNYDKNGKTERGMRI